MNAKEKAIFKHALSVIKKQNKLLREWTGFFTPTLPKQSAAARVLAADLRAIDDEITAVEKIIKEM